MDYPPHYTHSARHKRGDTFDVSGPITVDVNGETVTDLTGWQGRSQIREQKTDAVIVSLAFEWLDASQGLMRLHAPAGTTAWPLGPAEIDIELESPEGAIVSTETTHIIITKDITRP